MNKLILTLGFGILASSAFAFTDPTQRERQGAMKSTPADNFDNLLTKQPDVKRRDAVKSPPADDDFFTKQPEMKRRDAMTPTTKRPLN